MAEIGCQLGQKIVQVSTTAIPRGDLVNRCGMPEVVHPGLAASVTVPSNARDRAQGDGMRSERCITQIGAVAAGKTRSRRPRNHGYRASRWRPYHGAQTVAQRNDARLEKLRSSMCINDCGMSTSSILRRIASPRRSPAPYRSRRNTRSVSASIAYCGPAVAAGTVARSRLSSASE